MPDWFVEHLTGDDPADDFLEDEFLLLLDLLEEASVLVGAPGQVRQHLHHGPVRDVLIRGVASLAWEEENGAYYITEINLGTSFTMGLTRRLKVT